MFMELSARGAELSGTKLQEEIIQGYEAGCQQAVLDTLTERTATARTHLLELGADIEIPNIVGELETVMRTQPGLEDAQADLSTFAWTPQANAMLSYAAGTNRQAWPTETYAVAAWNVGWDKGSKLGSTAILLFQRSNEVEVEPPHIAVVSHDLALPTQTAKTPLLMCY
jgi:hypothetical protein